MKNKYRTHNLAQLNAKNIEENVILTGFLHNKRDHGGVLFIDLRDFFGITQLTTENKAFVEELSKLKLECVITFKGKVQKRPAGSENKNLPTGEIEVEIESYEIQSVAEQIPFQINGDDEINEEMRLTYRFLDLRRKKMKDNIILRSKVIKKIRDEMYDAGFFEFNTPILTASSPEGARDFLVPSRLNPGKFYALPQAPQQFKQILMISGFDKYFQIAPCFRDEDARADRSPGDFYQLDIEMSYVEQEDVFNTMEPIIYNLFKEFSNGRTISGYPFRRIKYEDSMLAYGNDKPDLRSGIVNSNVSDLFKGSGFSIFEKQIEKGAVVIAIPAPNASGQSRKFYDDMIAFAQANGAGGLAYINFDENGSAKGPISKFFDETRTKQLLCIECLEGLSACKLSTKDAVLFACGEPAFAKKLAGLVRTEIAKKLGLLNNNHFEFCWIYDFPFYEKNEETGQIDFCHNPFSMPQGGLDTLLISEPEKFIDFKKWSDEKYQLSININEVKKLNPNGEIFKTITNNIHNLLAETKKLTGQDALSDSAKINEILSKTMGCSVVIPDGVTMDCSNTNWEGGYYIIDKSFDNIKNIKQALINIVFKGLNTNPLDIKAFQYDIVCNGIELSSGAIRNHNLDCFYKAFEIAGYSKQQVEERFTGMVKALSYGVPPHGGIAPGIDRMVMMLAGESNIREVIAFPLTSKGQCLLLNAPSVVDDKQLRDLGLITKWTYKMDLQ